MPLHKLSSDLDRFISKVDRTTTPDGCWLWAGSITTYGYGQMTTGSWPLGTRRSTVAHRFALERALGRPLTPGMCALHTCDVRHCVRTDPPGVYVLNGIERPCFGHLFEGSTQENTADRHAKGRSAVGSRMSNAVFTEAQVVEIRLRQAAGERQADLAREFDVDPSAIGLLVRRKTWRHV